MQYVRFIESVKEFLQELESKKEDPIMVEILIRNFQDQNVEVLEQLDNGIIDPY